MSDRSGCGPAELAVLEGLETLTAGRRPQHHVKTARVLAEVDKRIGLGPRYAYQMLVELARPWTIAVRLVSGPGNFGDRVFHEPAGANYTESSSRSVLMVANGLLETISGPYAVTGSEIGGDVAGLMQGQPTEIREIGQVTLTGDPDIGRPRFQAHITIESLPAEVTVPYAIEAIVDRSNARQRRAYPDLAERTGLPLADLTDDSRGSSVSIHLKLSPGSDPAAVRERLREVDGITWSSTWQFPAPVTKLLRSWTKRHRDEDLAASLTQLEQAIREDRGQDNRE